MNNCKKQIREFIFENFLFDADATALQDDTSFLEQGIIDSTGILEVINWLEETFSMKIDDEEMIPDNLDSVNNLAVFIARKTG